MQRALGMPRSTGFSSTDVLIARYIKRLSCKLCPARKVKHSRTRFRICCASPQPAKRSPSKRKGYQKAAKPQGEPGKVKKSVQGNGAPKQQHRFSRLSSGAEKPWGTKSTRSVKRQSPRGGKQATQLDGRAQNLARTAMKQAMRVDLQAPPPGTLRPFVEMAAEVMQEFGRDQGAEVDGGRGQQGRGRSRGARKSLHHALLEAHQKAFQGALKAELAEEWSAVEERLNSWPRHRLQEDGLALFDLEAEPAGALFRDTILRFAMPVRGTPLPFHTFSHGDIVLISRGSPGDGAVEGVVMDYSTRWLRIAVPESAAGSLRGGPWQVVQYANTTAHDRCMEALENFRRPQPGTSEGALALRKALLASEGSTALTASATSQPSWARGKAAQAQRRLAVSELESIASLNRSQIAAIDAALRNTLTLWQGPPGTGKTTTLLQLLRLARRVLGKGQVLAVAASNVAVDNLLAGLLGCGVRVVRMGQPVKVLPELLGATLEAKVAEHPAGRTAALLRERAARLPGPSARAAREQAMELEERATKEVLDIADVVAATCIAAGDPRLAGRKFRLCAMDEATQGTEAAALVALLQLCEAAVLVGDQCQLPPTVVSRQALEGGLGLSLFERLQQAGLSPHLLNVQYRMHPAIAEFPSAAFYDSKVTSHPQPQDRPAPAGFAWPNIRKPIAFLDCSHPEERTAEAADAATSYRNVQQARMVVEVVAALLAGKGLEAGPSDIGVITPYSGQVRELRSQLATLPSGNEKMLILDELEVKTVDGFQGREKEAIVFSAVRSNSSGTVGFLADKRRLHVALTRAKRALVVIGCRRTMSRDPTWRAWLTWIDKNGLAVRAAAEKQQEALVAF